jgi:undecaprenol kinase/diacylglycerol kinase (ATP)
MYVFYKTSNHFYIIIFSIIVVFVLGFYLNVSSLEWIALVFSVGFVIVSEIFNTAIEIDIDLTSPQYHPFARDTKDVAAAAVVLSVFTAAIIGCIVFVPKIF